MFAFVTFIETCLDEGNAHGVLLYHLLQWLADSRHKGVRQNEDENVSVTGGAEQIRVGDNVHRELVSRQVLDVLMLCVDNLTQLATIHHFLVDVHANFIRKVRVFSGIGANDLGDSRAPVRWLVGRDCIISTQLEGLSLGCQRYQLPEPMMATLRIMISKCGYRKGGGGREEEDGGEKANRLMNIALMSEISADAALWRD